MKHAQMERPKQADGREVEELLESLYVAQVESEDAPPARRIAPRRGGLARGGGPLRTRREAGLVCRPRAGPVLTEAGREAARSVVRRHRLAECLLRDVLRKWARTRWTPTPASLSTSSSTAGRRSACCWVTRGDAPPRPAHPGRRMCAGRPPPTPPGAWGSTEGPLERKAWVSRLQTTSRRRLALGVLPGVPIRLLHRTVVRLPARLGRFAVDGSSPRRSTCDGVSATRAHRPCRGEPHPRRITGTENEGTSPFSGIVTFFPSCHSTICMADMAAYVDPGELSHGTGGEEPTAFREQRVGPRQLGVAAVLPAIAAGRCAALAPRR